MKQYVVLPAYTDNYHVIQVVDGKILQDNIVAYYNLSGYTGALENHGYRKAYFVPKAKKELEAAKRAYLEAQAEYDNAIENALEISDNEAKRSYEFAKILEPDDLDVLPFLDEE